MTCRVRLALGREGFFLGFFGPILVPTSPSTVHMFPCRGGSRVRLQGTVGDFSEVEFEVDFDAERRRDAPPPPSHPPHPTHSCSTHQNWTAPRFCMPCRRRLLLLTVLADGWQSCPCCFVVLLFRGITHPLSLPLFCCPCLSMLSLACLFVACCFFPMSFC